MVRYIKIFFQMSAANLKGMMAFKVDFLVSFFAGLLSQTVGLLFLTVLFQNIPAVAGWTVYEVAMLYGFIYVSEGVLTLFFQGTNGLWWQVKQGMFDRYIVRPLPVELQIYGRLTNLAGGGTAITGIVVMAVSLSNLHVVMPAWKILLLIVSLFLGAVIRVNINFAANCLGVITQGGVSGTTAIYKVQELAKYPLSIYPKAFQLILISILPFAAISYVPTAVILDKAEPVYWLILPFAAILIIFIRRAFFGKALQTYEGAGN